MPHSIETFVCSGCREQIRVCEPETGCVALECPIADCRRELWALPRMTDGAMLGARVAPDLSRKFSVDQYRLLLRGVELLAGPADLMARFADILNADDPADEALPLFVRGLISQHGRGCTFQPGRELVRLGMESLQRRPEDRRHA
jgi:hypothetical protein